MKQYTFMAVILLPWKFKFPWTWPWTTGGVPRIRLFDFLHLVGGSGVPHGKTSLREGPSGSRVPSGGGILHGIILYERLHTSIEVNPIFMEVYLLPWKLMKVTIDVAQSSHGSLYRLSWEFCYFHGIKFTSNVYFSGRK